MRIILINKKYGMKINNPNESKAFKLDDISRDLKDL